MKPILVLQHLSSDGPGYFGTWLQAQGVPMVVRNTEAGDAFPAQIAPYAGLCVLGGEMSANDPLPSLRQAEDLIRQAVAAGVPVIGHCLGGQLMARALGGRVRRSPRPEVGWQRVDRQPGDEARAWWGDEPAFTAFQWHAEAFDLPPGARLLAGNAACPNQAFVIGPHPGLHLGMQFHIEVDVDKVMRWSASDGAQWLADQQAWPATVQGRDALRAGLATELPAHQARAARVYARWLAGVRAAAGSQQPPGR